MKKLLIIADDITNFNIKSNTTYMLFLTAQDLNFNIYYCQPQDVYAQNNQAFATVEQVTVIHGIDKLYSTLKWCLLDNKQPISLNYFDAICVRNDPPFNMEYYYLTQMLEFAEANGVRVINSPSALRNFNEKLSILNFPDLIAPTLISKDKQIILNFVNNHFDCVVKPIDLMAGRGVFKINPADTNLNVILETITNYFSQTVMLQKFIPEVIQGDKRIFIVHGKIVDFCLYRIPQDGQIRGNLAVGGRGEVHPLNEKDYLIASKVANWLKDKGIVFAGIDVIGEYLTEINITSPTAAHQIYQSSGINVLKLLLEAI